MSILDELVATLGFRDAKEMSQLVARVDISTPEKLAAFQKWKDEDGTKTGLEKLMTPPPRPA